MENMVVANVVFVLALMSGSYGHILKPSEVDRTITCPSKTQYNFVMLNKLADAERDMRNTVHGLTDTVHSLTEQMIHCQDEIDQGQCPVPKYVPPNFPYWRDRRQAKQFCFLDADCLVVGESQITSRRSAGKYPVKPPRPEDVPHVAFYAVLSQSLSGIANHEVIKFDHVKTNVGEAYNPESGEFEAPVAGTYAFHWVHTNHDGTYMTTELYANDQIYGKAVSDSGDHNDRSVGSNFVILQLEKGDKVWIRASDNWHNGKMLGEYLSTFSGYRLF